jgi:hypothetical protein
MAGARYEVRGSIAIISMDNPPVNGLGYDNRLGIVNGLNKANADDAVKAIVLTGLGKAFSGGADIREFGTAKAGMEPSLHAVIRYVQSQSWPQFIRWSWVVALNWPSAAIIGSARKAHRLPCPKSSSAYFRVQEAPKGFLA